MSETTKSLYAGTATVGEKGQIVIPKAVRDMLSIRPGDTVLILADRDRGIAIPAKPDFEQMASAIFGEAKE